MTNDLPPRMLLALHLVALSPLFALIQPASAAVIVAGDTFVSLEGALFLGNTAPGSAEVTAPGATFPHIVIGNGANGQVTVSGTGTTLNVTNAIQTGSLSSRSMVRIRC